MQFRTAIVVGTALFLAPLFSLQAQIPSALSYQGIVTDAAGDAKPDGTYRFQFEIYDAEAGGNLLWGPQTEDLEVADGLFYTQLGPFPNSVAFDIPYWLGIIVGGEVLSRVALTSVGYSFHALRADTASYALSVAGGGGAGDITAVIAGSGLTGGGTSGDITLSLASSLYVTEISATSSIVVVNTGSTDAGHFEINNPSSSSSALYVKTNGTGNAGYFRIDNTSSTNHALYVTTLGLGRAGYFRIDNASSTDEALYARTNGTGYAGYFAGNVYTTGSYQGSDIRWKNNIATINGALDKALSLRGVQFEWNRDDYPDKGFREGKQIGLIAQEVEEILPELVRTDQDGYKAVEYQKITAVLVEAIKEQQKEIKELKAAVANLQAQSDVVLQE